MLVDSVLETFLVNSIDVYEKFIDLFILTEKVYWF